MILSRRWPRRRVHGNRAGNVFEPVDRLSLFIHSQMKSDCIWQRRQGVQDGWGVIKLSGEPLRTASAKCHAMTDRHRGSA